MSNKLNMTGFEWMQAVRQENLDADLTDKQLDKLKGECTPGCKVKIYWVTEHGTNIIDEGYVFECPDMDADSGDCFVHVPNPDNPGGKDNADPEFIYMIALMQNPLCKKIVCI